MFSDRLNQFKYPYVIPERNNDINIRKNPFLNNNINDIEDECFDSDISDIGNITLVNSHFEGNLASNNGMSSVDSLTITIKQCKQQILNQIDNLQLKEKLIEKLIKLNEELHIAKEMRTIHGSQESFGSETSLSDNRLINIAGHSLIKIRQSLGQMRRCEVCCGPVITGRCVYHCDHCIVYVHINKYCLRGLNRRCPASDIDYSTTLPSQMLTRSKFSPTNNNCYLNIDFYPVSGNLTSQKFLCAECNRPIKAVSKTDPDLSKRSQTQFCHYYCRFYCSTCHWGNKSFIPSVYFMLNKWKKMSICRSAYINLMYMWGKTLFRMPLFWEQFNPSVENVLIIRRKLFSLRYFIKNCQIIKKTHETYPEWIIDQPYLVTMKFVEGMCDGSALETVQVLYSTIVAHIPQCETCHRLCNSCYLCSDPEILHVMSRTVWTCSLCFVTCIHEKCGLSRFKEKSKYICLNCSKP